jgi:uncharacterized membrane protein YgdD (TMEM256/DUF423 family)
MSTGLTMNCSRKLLALLMVAALLFAVVATASSAHSAAILVPIVLFCGCLTTVSLRRVIERSNLPSSPFRPLLASRAPPVR